MTFRPKTISIFFILPLLTNAMQGSIPPTVDFSAGTYNVNEGMMFTVEVIIPSNNTVPIIVEIAFGSPNDTASQYVDYDAPDTVTVEIAPGDLNGSYSFQLLADCLFEAEEEFHMEIVSVTESTDMYRVGTTDPTAMVIIADGEGTSNVEFGFSRSQFVFNEGEVKSLLEFTARNPCLGSIVGTSEENIIYLFVSESTGTAAENQDFMLNNFTVAHTGQLTTSLFNGIEMNDDLLVEPVEYFVVSFALSGNRTNLGLYQTATIIIIDNDSFDFACVANPPSLPRKSRRDINIYALTTDPAFTLELTKNMLYRSDVAPMSPGTLYNVSDGADLMGMRLMIPKPATRIKYRFGSYICKEQSSITKSVPTFVEPKSELFGADIHTYTLNKGDNKIIDVSLDPRFKRQYRLTFNGKIISKRRNPVKAFQIKINDATKGIHDGFYEMYRVNKGNKEVKIVIRVIVRECEAGMVVIYGDCVAVTDDPCTCYNGGVCAEAAGDQTGIPFTYCICPGPFYGKECNLIGEVGTFGQTNAFDCGRLGIGAADCKGDLLCYEDPLGCRCAAGYRGRSCQKSCADGLYGADCTGQCHCDGEDVCHHVTGICPGSCASGWSGNNCQTVTL